MGRGFEPLPGANVAKRRFPYVTSTSGIRTQHPCLSGTVPYRFNRLPRVPGITNTHGFFLLHCFPTPTGCVLTPYLLAGVRWVVGSSHCQAPMLQKEGSRMSHPRAGFEPSTPVFPGQCPTDYGLGYRGSHTHTLMPWILLATLLPRPNRLCPHAVPTRGGGGGTWS